MLLFQQLANDSRPGGQEMPARKLFWLLNCLRIVLEYMRIEAKARRDGSTFELFAQSGAGATNAALLVRLFGDRQPAESFLDLVCSPISLLNFEPFCSTMRPNGLSDENRQKLLSRCETKRPQTALYKEAGDESFTGFMTEGPRRKQRF